MTGTDLKVSKTSLGGVLLLEPKCYGDSRGFFMESYSRRKLADAGVDMDFVQDNHSRSSKGTLRGLHYQIKHSQAKFVRVCAGSAFDVALDLRRSSPTFGKWESFTLSAENRLQLFVPAGFAHGFCALEDSTEFLYKCGDYYFPEHERGILWSDPKLNIPWPVKNPLLSAKDAVYPLFDDCRDFFD
jgi:dTDP-4-dehydrorhamnose 3,5-epimerase